MKSIEKIRRYLRLIEDNVYGADIWIEGIREELEKLEGPKCGHGNDGSCSKCRSEIHH